MNNAGHIITLVMVLSASTSTWAASNLALRLDNSLAYVEIPRLRSSQPMTNISVEAWVRLSSSVSSTRQSSRAVFARMLTESRASVVLSVSIPFPIFKLYDGTNETDCSTFQGINYDSWAHIAATYNGVVARIYVDGRFAGSAQRAPVTIQAGETAALIGHYVDPERDAWIGSLDEVRLWNTALSEDEVRSRMHLKLGGKEPNLIGYWSFDGADARDLSVFENHGVLRGDVQFVVSPLDFKEAGRLSVDRFDSVNGLSFFLTGSPETDYRIQSTRNFLTWEDLLQTRVSSEPVMLRDSTATSHSERFYRATPVLSASP